MEVTCSQRYADRRLVGMNYIGSKLSIIEFIEETITKIVGEYDKRSPSQMVFADLFAGTGSVGARFKEIGYSVISNDIQYYSYVLNRHLIMNNNSEDKTECNRLIATLNALDGTEGFIYNNYSGDCAEKRMYFTGHNAKKCDAVRTTIEDWHRCGLIDDALYYFLLASLIDSIDKVANTASVYGSFLKRYKKTALKEMVVKPLYSVAGQASCEVYNEDATELIKQIQGDILYLDPPYNSRQYCSNYHVLETIARYDNPTIISGKTGLRQCDAQKSDFCSKRRAVEALEEIIESAKFKYIFLSYNNEGLIPKGVIEQIMKARGDYSIIQRQNRRCKADNNRHQKSDSTIEYLHCLIKNK